MAMFIHQPKRLEVPPSPTVIRDTPNRLTIAEKLITDLSTQPLVAASATETPLGSESGFVLNRRASRSFGTAQSQLQMTVSGPFSFDMNESARQGYEEVAARAGLRVVFDGRFRDAVTAVLKLENVSAIDALDFLSLQTGNIWEVMDANTIIIGPDVPTVRNELERRAAKTIRVSNVGTEALTEILTALRTILNLRHVAGPSAIVIEDTAANIAFAERIVAALDRPARR